jgi:ribosomal protein L22
MTPERPSDPRPDEAPEPASPETEPTAADPPKDAAAEQAGEAAQASQAAAKPARSRRRAKRAAAGEQPTDKQRSGGQAKDQTAKAKAPAKKRAGTAQPAAAQPAEPAEAAPSAAAAARRAPRGARATPRRGVVRARARYVRTSARKARIVCVHLRGKTVAEARAILAFTPREVARDWSKLLESAVANAEANHELLEDDLIIRDAYADEGPTIKRFRPRAMGRATPIHKRTSHLTIALTPDREPTTKTKKAG